MTKKLSELIKMERKQFIEQFSEIFKEAYGSTKYADYYPDTNILMQTIPNHYDGTNMQEYLEHYGVSYYQCECGADKTKLDQYSHSTWCPKYIAPVPITDNCNCGVGPWHSPDCKKRVWPKKEVDAVQNLQLKLKKAVEQLNATNTSGPTKGEK